MAATMEWTRDDPQDEIAITVRIKRNGELHSVTLPDGTTRSAGEVNLFDGNIFVNGFPGYRLISRHPMEYMLLEDIKNPGQLHGCKVYPNGAYIW